VEHDNEPTLRDLIDLLRHGLLIAIGAAVVVAAAAFLISRAVPPTFEAQATVVTSSQDPNQRSFGTTLVTAPPLDAASYRAAIAGRTVLADALRTIDGTPPSAIAVEDLDKALTVRSEGTNTASLFRLQVRDGDAERARDIANAIAAAAVTWDEQRATRALEVIVESLQAQIASIDLEIAAAGDTPIEGLTRTRADLALQLSSARALRSGAVGRLELLETAVAPRTPVSPRPIRNAALAGLLAIFLTYGLLLLRNALDTRLRGLDDLARTTKLPVLAEFPVVAGRRRLPPEAASYLRTAIGFATTDADPKVLLVTSTGPGHGKSSVAMALAESFARQDYRVLLLDFDLRKPVLGNEYGLDPIHTPTARDALDNPHSAAPTRIGLERDVAFDILPSFVAAPNPTELLSNHARDLLHRLAPHYDVIVIDSAPVLPVADALTVAPHATGVVFAVSMPDADRRQVTSAIELLQRVGVRVLGTVATNLSSERRGRQGYGYGYGYGAAERTTATPTPIATQRLAVTKGVGSFASSPAAALPTPATPRLRDPTLIDELDVATLRPSDR